MNGHRSLAHQWTTEKAERLTATSRDLRRTIDTLSTLYTLNLAAACVRWLAVSAVRRSTRLSVWVRTAAAHATHTYTRHTHGGASCRGVSRGRTWLGAETGCIGWCACHKHVPVRKSVWRLFVQYLCAILTVNWGECVCAHRRLSVTSSLSSLVSRPLASCASDSGVMPGTRYPLYTAR